MTSLELGETEEIAKQYSNGNISKFIRDLIMNYHHKQMKKTQEHKTSKKIFLFQNSMFLFLGFTFLVVAINAVTSLNVITFLAVACLFLSGTFSFLYAIIGFIISNKIKEVVVE